MIKKMSLEPKLKRIYVLVAVLLFILVSGFLFIQHNQFENIHHQQIKTYQRVVGKLVEKYPEEEANIVKYLLADNDINAEEKGALILNKYGYNLEKKIDEDPTFNIYKRSYIFNSLTSILTVIILVIIIIYFISKYVYKYLQKISHILNSFINGNFSHEEEFEDEGLVNIINYQLNQLGRNISLNYAKLESEKESSKALVTDISHQLKTPLASLSMCNSILEDDDLTLEEKREFLDMSNKNINKLHSLIDSLVNISRLEVAMIKLNPERNNLRDTILNAYNSAYVKAKNKGIDINLGKINSNIIAKHDVKWTEEAIFNVLDNGIKYTDNGGKIDINVEESINYVKIAIKDTGVGINKKEFNNIFKRFHRCKDAEVNNIEGSGVGLYLSRKILEDQGGSIMVKSKKGEGSLFTLLVPKN